jgi:hypothetical protein
VETKKICFGDLRPGPRSDGHSEAITMSCYWSCCVRPAGRKRSLRSVTHAAAKRPQKRSVFFEEEDSAVFLRKSGDYRVRISDLDVRRRPWIRQWPRMVFELSWRSAGLLTSSYSGGLGGRCGVR